MSNGAEKPTSDLAAMEGSRSRDCLYRSGKCKSHTERNLAFWEDDAVDSRLELRARLQACLVPSLLPMTTERQAAVDLWKSQKRIA